MVVRTPRRTARQRRELTRPDREARSVLVTGATSGIGLEAALRLAGRGFRTFGSARSDEQADRLRRVAHAAGLVIEPVVFDLTDAEAGDAVIADLQLWALVNNAGWANVGRLADVPLPSARRQLEAMVVAPMRLTQLALPGMRARGGGRIVNVSSSGGRVAGPFLGWYEASKHAIEALSEALRIETTDPGVAVVLIEPGSHRSNIWNKAARDLERRGPHSERPAAYDRAHSILRTLEPRMPRPQPVAAAIERAVVDECPKRRYRVGADAVVLDVLGAVTPAAVRDRILRGILRL